MSERIEHISQGELEALLIRVMGAKAVGIVALTVPSCFSLRVDGSRKKDAALCPPVMKRQHVTGITNFEYERSRNNDNARVWSRKVEELRAAGQEDEARELEQAGPEAHELKGRSDSRQRIDGTPLVRNDKGHVYVVMMLPTGANPKWPKGRHETAYCYLPAHRGLLLEHWAKKAKGQLAENGGPWDDAKLAAAPAVEYDPLDQDDHPLAPWLKPYKRSDQDPVDFDYREYRTDHILEVRHEGVRYVVKQPAEAAA